MAIAALTAIALVMSQRAKADHIKVVSGGAFEQVLDALAARYQKEDGTRLDIAYQTVGQHLALIRDGRETFDIAVLTPEAIDGLVKQGKVIAGSKVALARVGVGVAVKAGAALPDISTVEAFKRALLAANAVAYIDPKAGGSSGIYVAGLLERLGLASAVSAKAVLVDGGAVADHIADGEAELGIHQISEILPVAGVTLVGPLSAEIQNYTVYAAGIGAATTNEGAARAAVRFMASPQALVIIKARGMETASGP